MELNNNGKGSKVRVQKMRGQRSETEIRGNFLGVKFHMFTLDKGSKVRSTFQLIVSKIWPLALFNSE